MSDSAVVSDAVAQPRIVAELQDALAAARSNVISSCPPYWPEFGIALDALLPAPLPPHVMIPLVATRASGGTIHQGVPFAAAWTLICTGVRILDDCADQDDPRAVYTHMGMGRAHNLATAMLTLAELMLRQMPGGSSLVLDEYLFTALRVWAAQDRDMRCAVTSGAEYLQLVEDKTGCAFAFAAASGARMATADEAIIEACRRCGHHIGIMLQLLDDLETCWFPDTQSDLAQGKLTFPIWFALEQASEDSNTLEGIVKGADRGGREAEILEILDRLDMRRAVLWAALDERDRAMDLIATCPETDGQRLLQMYMDHVFKDVAAMLAPPPARLDGP